MSCERIVTPLRGAWVFHFRTMSDPNFSDWSDVRLEALATSEYATPPERGAAKAELVRRQRQHEVSRDERRHAHDITLFDKQGRRDAAQQDFDERLAGKQREHAERIAAQQMRPAVSSARATVFAAISAGLSTIAVLISAVVGYLEYHDQHRAQYILGKPLVDFYTEDDEVKPIVGIQIMNEGSVPVLIKGVEYFVDGKPVGGHDDATKMTKLNPEKIGVYDFERGDSLTVGEKEWLYYRLTNDKADLASFIKFVDDRVTVGVKLCSLQDECIKRCSSPGKCGHDYAD